MPAHKLEELRGSKTFMLHLNNMAQLVWPMCGGNNLRKAANSGSLKRVVLGHYHRIGTTSP